MDSIQLVKKAKAGDKEAPVKLIMLRKDEYYKLAYAYTGEKEDTLDALSDMIIILYEKIRKLRKADGEKIPLEEIMQWPRDFYKTEEGMTHERVFRFAATGEDLKLKIARIAYTKKYHEIINIPLE